jgi:DNA replication protein DnaC
MSSNKRHRCLLAPYSRQADSEYMPTMTDACVAFHGLNGDGGRVGAANIPADYRYITIANSPARESQAKLYKALDTYIRTFERQFDPNADRIKSIYLFSESPGTGKTTTACALLNEWLVAHYLGSLKRGKQPLQTPAYFLDVNEFQTRYNLATLSNDEAELGAIKAEIRKCQAVSFLAMDDIGVRGATEAFRSYLHAIINHRATNGLPTIYTSNLDIADMARIFDERLYDRMRDMCAVMEFEGESKRGRR